MLINRREHLRQLLILGGALVLPIACSGPSKESSLVYNNLEINEEDETLMADLVEVLIPETDVPGARSLDVHLFVLKMVDDCHDRHDREQFVAGLRDVDLVSNNLHGMSFQKSNHEQRVELLNALEKGNAVSAEAKRFYQLFKKRAIQGYLYSEYVMKNITKYELIPGRYNGWAKL